MYRILASWAVSYVIAAAVIYAIGLKLGANTDYLIATITGLGLLLGYVVAHVLEIDRKRNADTFNHYLDLVKGLRLFINESDLRKSGRLQELRDRFQDAYFSSTILISAKAYEKFRIMADSFERFLDCKSKKEGDQAKSDFVSKQSALINELRKEFLSDGNIDFQTFDFRIGSKGVESFSPSSIPVYPPNEATIDHTLPRHNQ